ncbi:C2H2-like zinc finger protein isoform X2 [Wolffia australiana]
MSEDGFPFSPSNLALHREPDKPNPNQKQQAASARRSRKLPGTPDPDAEVIALSPKTLMATNRFICEICNKGFQRDQNLQLHRRGHNLPWKLKQRTGNEVVRKKVYVCPEKSCVHHDPSRALGDLTGIKKHFSRKHGEKKWKCDKCSKKYAVQSDWKAHIKICGTREYRKDSFITHRAFCDALTEESARLSSAASAGLSFKSNDILEGDGHLHSIYRPAYEAQEGLLLDRHRVNLSLWLENKSVSSQQQLNPTAEVMPSADYLAASSMALPELFHLASPQAVNFGACFQTGSAHSLSNSSFFGLPERKIHNQQLELNPCAAHMSATAMLQKAAQMGSSTNHHSSSASSSSSSFPNGFSGIVSSGKGIVHPTVDNKSEFSLFNPDQEFFLTSVPATTSSSAGVMATMMRPQGPPKTGTWPHEVGRALTRDFLGVGGEETRPPFLQHELAPFASIDPEMHLMSASYSSLR